MTADVHCFAGSCRTKTTRNAIGAIRSPRTETSDDRVDPARCSRPVSFSRANRIVKPRARDHTTRQMKLLRRSEKSRWLTRFDLFLDRRSTEYRSRASCAFAVRSTRRDDESEYRNASGLQSFTRSSRLRVCYMRTCGIVVLHGVIKITTTTAAAAV